MLGVYINLYMCKQLVKLMELYTLDLCILPSIDYISIKINKELSRGGVMRGRNAGVRGLNKT